MTQQRISRIALQQRQILPLLPSYIGDVQIDVDQPPADIIVLRFELQYLFVEWRRGLEPVHLEMQELRHFAVRTCVRGMPRDLILGVLCSGRAFQDEDQFAMQPANRRPPYPYVNDEQRKVARDAYVSWHGSRYSVPGAILPHYLSAFRATARFPVWRF
jgi:hypothetical protein